MSISPDRKPRLTINNLQLEQLTPKVMARSGENAFAKIKGDLCSNMAFNKPLMLINSAQRTGSVDFKLDVLERQSEINRRRRINSVQASKYDFMPKGKVIW